jgi:DNA-binding protein Fis
MTVGKRDAPRKDLLVTQPNMACAVEILGLDRSTLRSRMVKLNIQKS